MSVRDSSIIWGISRCKLLWIYGSRQALCLTENAIWRFKMAERRFAAWERSPLKQIEFLNARYLYRILSVESRINLLFEACW